MRIIHIMHHLKNLGNGITNAVVDLACIQAQSGHDVAVVSSGGDYEVLLKTYGVTHFLRHQKAPKPFHHMEAIQQYWRILNTFQPHIVHAHLPRETVLARLLKLRFNYLLVATVHCEFQWRAILLSLADIVIAVSQGVADSMQRRGINPKKLRVIRNGTIGSPRSKSIQEYQPLPLMHPTIVTVAGMFHRKGIAELIAAFVDVADEFPKAHLYLVGNGPDRSQFEAQAQQSSVATRIHFEGFQTEPQRYLLSTDIFVLVSHKDPSPLVIPEAREAGCAIIGSDVDGIPEALDLGKAGLLVPPADSQQLADALRRLLQDPELLAAWRTKALTNIEWLSVQRVSQETLNIYQQAMGSDRGQHRQTVLTESNPTFEESEL
jgi:glycosyltransferase involved in cell wall biosynthesis